MLDSVASIDDHPRFPSPAATQGVRLLEADPDWQSGLDPISARRATHHLVLPALDVPRGMPCAPPATPAVVVHGCLLRAANLAGRRTVRLLGPGDIVAADDDEGSPAIDATCEALEPARLALLDARFSEAAQRWPSLTTVLVRRLLAQERRSFCHPAIATMPRVEERLLAVLWHLADRFGRMTAEAPSSTSACPTRPWASSSAPRAPRSRWPARSSRRAAPRAAARTGGGRWPRRASTCSRADELQATAAPLLARGAARLHDASA